MKKTLLLLIAILSISITTFAQVKEESTDNTAKFSKFRKLNESESKDRLFLVLSHDNLFHKETNGFATKWYSRGVGLYFMWDFQIKKSRFSVAPGIGYNHVAYYHNAEMLEDSSGVSFPIIHDLKNEDDFKRIKLSLHYLDVPLELRFRHKFKNDLSLKLAVGLKGSVKISASSKEVKKGPNDYFKHYNVTNYKDLNTWRLGPTFRMGYGAVNLLMYYDLLPLFKKGKGPKMTPFSIGIAITTL